MGKGRGRLIKAKEKKVKKQKVRDQVKKKIYSNLLSYLKVSASPQTLLQEISDHFVHIKRKIKVGKGRVISTKAVEKKSESRQWNMTRLLPLIVSFVARLPNFKLLPGHCVRTCNLLPQSVHSLLSEMNTCSQNSIS